MKAQIMETWNPKIIFGASAKTLRNFFSASPTAYLAS